MTNQNFNNSNESKKDSLPSKGKILISEPFIQDNVFSRSVIYLIDCSDEGSIGLVLNKNFPLDVNDIVKSLKETNNIPLFCGGPVGSDTLFYLHNLNNISNAIDAGNGLYLNGNFEQIKNYKLNNEEIEGHIRFFLGYSGWDKGQLMNEIKMKTGVVSSCSIEETMNTKNTTIWDNSVLDLGNKYKIWTHFPYNPTLN